MFESPRLTSSLRSIRLARGASLTGSPGGGGRRGVVATTDNDDDDDAVVDLGRWSQLHDAVNVDDDDDDAMLADPIHRKQISECCILVTIVGVGYLFPFSALTQPVDYWQLLFPDFNMEFPLTTMYMWTNLGMLALLVFCGGEGTPHFTRRIVGGFIGQLIVLIVVPTSYFGHFDEGTDVIWILGSTAVAATVTAFIDSSVIALVAQYPLRVQEYFQLGVGVSTLIGSVYRDVTKISFPPDAVVESSLLYFYTGAATIGICIMAYFRMMQLPLSKKCLAKAIAEEEEMHHHPPHHHPFDRTDVDLDKDEDDDHDEIPTEVSELVPKKESQVENSGLVEVDRWTVLRKVFFNECMVLLLFLSTLALWPPLVTEIPAYATRTQVRLGESGWWSLILLTIFSTADCSGRLLVRFRMGLNKDNIWIAVAARFLLFPLIVGQVQGYWFAITVDSWMADAWSGWLVALLGLTNGYVGTLCIVLVNDCLETTQEQALAGTFTSFFLNSGLVLGATFGMIFDSFVN